MKTIELPARHYRQFNFEGTPNDEYHLGYEDIAQEELEKQAAEIAKQLPMDEDDRIPEDVEKKEITALIAYLMRLGTDIKADGEE